MRRTAIVALFVVVLAGCGGSGNSTEVVLHPTDPRGAGIYLSLTAPSDITKYLEQWAVTRNGGFIVVSKPRGPQVCSYTAKITEALIHDTVPASAQSRVTKYVGHAYTLAIYGTDPQDLGTCKRMPLAIRESERHLPG